MRCPCTTTTASSIIFPVRTFTMRAARTAMDGSVRAGATMRGPEFLPPHAGWRGASRTERSASGCRAVIRQNMNLAVSAVNGRFGTSRALVSHQRGRVGLGLERRVELHAVESRKWSAISGKRWSSSARVSELARIAPPRAWTS